MSNQDLKQREENGVYDDGQPDWYKPSVEADPLEEQFKNPSATNKDYPGSHPNRTEKPNDSEDNQSSEEDGGWSNKTSSTQKKRKLTSKQKGVIGGIIGLLMGGGLSLMGLLTGPLQMMHFSQLLQNTHFSMNDMVGRSRAGKLIRYAAADSPERRNMTFLGNRVADRYQNKLRANGFELDFQRPDGTQARTIQNMRVDVRTPQGQDFARTLHANGARVSEFNMQNRPGYIEVPFDKSVQGRRAINAALNTLNLNKASTAVAKRSLKIRANVNFKPMTNATRERGETLRSFWQNRNEADAERRRTGSQTQNVTVNAHDSGTPDEPNISDEANRNAQDLEQVRSGDDLDSKRRAVGDVSRSYAARGAGLAGIACLVKGVYGAQQAIMYANIILPLMRIGVDYVSVGEQIKASHDFNMEELGRYHDTMYDEENESSVFSADSVRAANGEQPVGNEMPAYAHPGSVNDEPQFMTIINGIPGLDSACSTIAGQIFMTVAGGLVNIGVEAALVTLRQAGIDPQQDLIEYIARRLAGEEIDGNPRGAMLGNYAMYGTRLASNDAMIGMGGRELNEEEERQVAQATREMLAIERSQKPLQQRLFDINDIDSVASRVVMRSYNISGDPISVINTIASLPFKMFSMVGGIATASSTLYASDMVDYDYGFPRFGFSMHELEGLGDDYDPQENAEILEADDSAKLREYNERYGECFNTTINPDNGRLETTSSVDFTDLDDECKDANDTDLRRYRLYLADMTLLKSLACLEMISREACEDIGMDVNQASTAGTQNSGQIIGDPNAPSNDIDCPQGTKDLGTDTPAYSGGQEIPTRLCEIVEWNNEGASGTSGYVPGSEGGVIVNSRVAGAWLALYEKSKSDGVNLRVLSAFRTMEHQQRLCNSNALCRNGTYSEVARPGTSNHQTGHAVDFMNIGGKKNGATCETRNRQTNSEEWVWLENNARDFGLKVYSVEPWHWDADTSSNRC